MKEQYRPQIHNSMIANQLFTYRNLTDDELDKYITIYETPEMRRLTEQLSNGMTEVFSERMQLMAKDFRKYLDENPPAKEPAPAAKAPAPKSKTTTKAPSK